MSNVSLKELQLAIASEQSFVDIVKQSPPEKTWEMALLLLSGYQWRILTEGGEAAYGDTALFHYLKQETKLKNEIRIEQEKPAPMQRLQYLSGLNRFLGEVRFYLGEIYLRNGKLTECEMYWRVVPPKYAGWKALHLSDAALREGDRNEARTRCLSIQCAEDSLLFLEKHWQLYQIYRAMHWSRDAAAALQVILNKEPEYRMVQEEAYKYFKEHHKQAAYELCCSRYAETGEEVWAARAVEMIGEQKADSPLLEPSRLLFEMLASKQEWEQWDRLADILYEREEHRDDGAFITFWLESLLDIIPNRQIIEQLRSTGSLLVHFAQRCDADPSLRERHGQVGAWVLMHFGVYGDNVRYIYEGAVRLLAMGRLNGEERQAVIDVLQQTAYHKLEQRPEKPYPWLTLAEAVVRQIESAGFAADEFHAALAGAAGFERRLLIAGSDSSGRTAVVSALLGEPAGLERSGQNVAAARIFVHTAEDRANDPCPCIQVDSVWLSDNHLALLELPVLEEWAQLKAAAEQLVRFADSIVLVLDATRPLTRLDREFVKGVLAMGGTARQLAFVFNRTELLGKKQLEKAERQVAAWLTEMLGLAPRLFIPANKRQAEAAGLQSFLLTVTPRSAMASRFESFDRKYELAFILYDRRLTEQAVRETQAGERYEQLQAQLKPLAELLNREIALHTEKISIAFDELKEAAKTFLLAHVPGLLRKETSQVYMGFDYKTLPAQVEEKLQLVLEQWARQQLPDFFTKELDGLSWQMEVSFEAVSKLLARVRHEREQLLACDEALTKRLEPYEEERWDELETRLAAAIKRFVQGQTYRTAILVDNGALTGMLRGLSSFFSGADKVLETVRQDLIHQLEMNGPLVVERYHESIFAAFEETVVQVCHTMLDTSRSLLESLQADIALAAERQAECGTMKQRSEQLQQQLRLRQQQQRYALSLWRIQVQQGVLLENGKLFRLT
ncbi:hypothetical protein [Paenibacillus sp. GCM10027626]|uniref:hypothetical protein n=1 Tax=Paenibacillus sp. GCM10027626 TaxID=3273411 RepID=UPI00363050E7